MLSNDDAKELNELAPEYLKGRKGTTRRVLWAIKELISMKREEREREGRNGKDARQG